VIRVTDVPWLLSHPGLTWGFLVACALAVAGAWAAARFLRATWRICVRYWRMGRPVGRRPEEDPFRLGPDDQVTFAFIEANEKKTAPKEGSR